MVSDSINNAVLELLEKYVDDLEDQLVRTTHSVQRLCLESERDTVPDPLWKEAISDLRTCMGRLDIAKEGTTQRLGSLKAHLAPMVAVNDDQDRDSRPQETLAPKDDNIRLAEIAKEIRLAELAHIERIRAAELEHLERTKRDELTLRGRPKRVELTIEFELPPGWALIKTGAP
ncbi:unnamed protein product [Mortierella alpina]